MAKIRVGITQGDTAGIGLEVILRSLADPRICDFITPVVYASLTAAEYYKKGIEECAQMRFSAVQSAAQTAGGKQTFLVNIDEGKTDFKPGKPTPQTGRAAVKALRAAFADMKAGKLDVLVTAPISKENSQGEDFKFAGHTEFIASEFGGEPTMMMCSEAMKVALVTSHISLAEVPAAISAEAIVGKLRTLRKTLISDFGIVEPRIAVLSLNPHAGEGGMLGREEEEIIKPAIRQAYAENIYAFGPFAADGLFLSGEHRKYDALLAMYHDQGLAPFKALTPDGVNFTAGLDVIRTSPDHGTAFDIAGKNLASPDSMRNAIYMAVDIARARARYAEASRNPLRRYEREKGADITLDLSKSDDEI